jgi:hypothetical protein
LDAGSDPNDLRSRLLRHDVLLAVLSGDAMNQPTFKDPWPKDHPIEVYQDNEARQIRIERDQKAWLDTTEHLMEAGQEDWLVAQITELYFRLVRK